MLMWGAMLARVDTNNLLTSPPIHHHDHSIKSETCHTRLLFIYLQAY